MYNTRVWHRNKKRYFEEGKKGSFTLTMTLLLKTSTAYCIKRDCLHCGREVKWLLNFATDYRTSSASVNPGNKPLLSDSLQASYNSLRFRACLCAKSVPTALGSRVGPMDSGHRSTIVDSNFQSPPRNTHRSSKQ